MRGDFLFSKKKASKTDPDINLGCSQDAGSLVGFVDIYCGEVTNFFGEGGSWTNGERIFVLVEGGR